MGKLRHRAVSAAPEPGEGGRGVALSVPGRAGGRAGAGRC